MHVHRTFAPVCRHLTCTLARLSGRPALGPVWLSFTLAFLTIPPLFARPAGAAAITPPKSATPHGERIAFEAWLGSNVTQGEPIALHYRIANRNGSTVVLNLVNQDAWLRLDLRDAAGTPVAARKGLRAAHAGSYPGTRPDIAPILPSGGIHRDSLVLTRQFGTLRPGAYRLQVEVRIPFVRGGQPMAGVFSCRRTLSFTVLPPAPQRLLGSARSLLGVASGEGPARERGVAVEALLSMPAEDAGPWSRALVREGRTDAVRHAIDELAGKDTREAADLLAEIAWDAQQPDALRERSRAALLHLWWNGCPAVRQRVESAFTVREGQMPETTSPPVLM